MFFNQVAFYQNECGCPSWDLENVLFPDTILLVVAIKKKPSTKKKKFVCNFLARQREDMRMIADLSARDCMNTATGPVSEDEQPGFFPTGVRIGPVRSFAQPILYLSVQSQWYISVFAVKSPDVEECTDIQE